MRDAEDVMRGDALDAEQRSLKRGKFSCAESLDGGTRRYLRYTVPRSVSRRFTLGTPGTVNPVKLGNNTHLVSGSAALP